MARPCRCAASLRLAVGSLFFPAVSDRANGGLRLPSAYGHGTASQRLAAHQHGRAIWNGSPKCRPMRRIYLIPFGVLCYCDEKDNRCIPQTGPAVELFEGSARAGTLG